MTVQRKVNRPPGYTAGWGIRRHVVFILTAPVIVVEARFPRRELAAARWRKDNVPNV